MAEKKDVSNATVAVLLALTILVTAVGTWLVVDALTGVSATAQPVGQPRDTAKVSLQIMEPPVDGQVAQVGLQIEEPPVGN